jgi:hypothetical protein
VLAIGGEDGLVIARAALNEGRSMPSDVAEVDAILLGATGRIERASRRERSGAAELGTLGGVGDGEEADGEELGAGAACSAGAAVDRASDEDGAAHAARTRTKKASRRIAPRGCKRSADSFREELRAPLAWRSASNGSRAAIVTW